MAAMIHSTPLAWAPPGQGRRRCRAGESRIVCIGDRSSKEEAARRALEEALGGKKEAFSKWDDEIRRREAASRGSGGGGKGRWGGFGGGGGSGGGGGDPANEGSWEEAKQVVFAFSGLLGIYFLLTNGKRSLVLLLNLPKYLLMGGKKSIAFVVNLPLLIVRALKRGPRKIQEINGNVPDGAPPPAKNAASQHSAKAHVINKWGRD